MTTPTEREAPEPDLVAGADEIEADIEYTREQLVNTVDALSQKLDVKAQARHAVQSLRTPRAAVTLMGAALAAALATAASVLVWRKRRR